MNSTEITNTLLQLVNSVKAIALALIKLAIPAAVILILLDIFLGTDFNIIESVSGVIGFAKDKVVIAAIVVYFFVTQKKAA